MESDNILRTFAAVTDGFVESDQTDVVGPRPFVWASYSCLDLFKEEDGNHGEVRIAGLRWAKAYEQMKNMGRAHRNEGLLRLGWIWFSGTVEKDGELVRYCFPAVSLSINRPRFHWQALSEAQITPLIADLDVRRSLLHTANFGDGQMIDRIDPRGDGRVEEVPVTAFADMPKLMTWCRDVSVQVGIRVKETYSLHGMPPTERRFQPGIALHVGAAMYVAEPTDRNSPSLSLTKLANTPGIRRSAFSLVYGDREPWPHAPRKVISFRPLSTRQRQVANQVAGQDLVVISGAPGTGKSHVLSVLAGDAIARGESVLVAAGSAHAVDVLVDHFREIPGPPPITFGGVRHGQRLLDEISELAEVVRVGRQRADVEARDEALKAQEERIAFLKEELLAERVHSALADPLGRQGLDHKRELAGQIRKLERLARQVTGATKTSKKIAASRRELIEKLGGDNFEERLLEVRLVEQILAGKRMNSGTAVARDFDELERNEAATHQDSGAALRKRWIRQVGTEQQLLLDRLFRILSDDVATRRGQLAGLVDRRLAQATPLWIGSVEEIDEVLPAVPRMFDLVILDEAAQIGQLEAATTLARANRAIICGDPKQITYRSYLSKEAFERAAFGHRTDADWLNPQSRSTYDVAAGEVPVAVLDEHFRSVPQLIGFSAKSFYEDNLHVMTRTPANEDAKRISVSVVDGSRNGDSGNSNGAEVAECLRIVEELMAKGWDSIGLISPFRAQADALTVAIEDRFGSDEIAAHGIRIGTVHQFQGDERSIVVVSFAVGEDEADSAWRFVNQPDLFNVMVTRARENLIVVTSNESPPGYAGGYVQWAEAFSASQLDAPSEDPWVQRVAEALQLFDIPVRTGYRVGSYTIDVVAGVGDSAVAIDCQVSDGDLAPHFDRALLLRRAGWRTTDAYESKWGEEPNRFVRSLLEEFPEIDPSLRQVSD